MPGDHRPLHGGVPNVRSEQLAREARRQAKVVAQGDDLGDDQLFIEAVSVAWDDERDAEGHASRGSL